MDWRRRTNGPTLDSQRTSDRSVPPGWGYAIAIALVLVAGIVQSFWRPPVVPPAPFLLFYPAIILASLLAGAGPGFAAIAASAAFSTFVVHSAPEAWNWIALAIVGPLLVAGCSRLRRIRLRAQAGLREVARFKYIGDHARDSILLLDEYGRIGYANLMAADHFRQSSTDLIGRPLESLIPDFQREKLREALRETRTGAPQTLDIALPRPASPPLVLEMALAGVWTEGEFVLHAVARDVTARREIEQRLSEIRHWESLGVMAGGIAHDFNNLLTTILGSTSLARETLPKGHESAVLLDRVMEAGERSADLVRLMTATAGYRTRTTEGLNPAQVLQNVLASRSLAQTVRMEVPDRLEVFPGDRRSLETLFWNLISNAADSYGDLDGEIRVALRSGPIEPYTQRFSAEELNFEEGGAPGDCLGIIVEDNGSGMRPEVLERAFDLFFSTKFVGRGLGLPVVRGIVRACSGALRITTMQGRGTRVEVWLPRSQLPSPIGSNPAQRRV
jgi:PAS domain S-box-containing protein